MAVGRASPTQTTNTELDRLVEDLRHYGAPEDVIAQAIADFGATVEDPTFLVHPDNVVAVRLFRAMSTQWRMLTISTLSNARVVRTGLIYEALPTVTAMSGLTPAPDDFARLQIMEAEALAAWREERD